jgi:hypothetical protein
MHLVGACLRLAAPHLAVCPPLVAYLEHAGFYALSRRQLAWAHRPARRMLGWLSRLALVDAKWMQVKSHLTSLLPSEARAERLKAWAEIRLIGDDLLTNTAEHRGEHGCSAPPASHSAPVAFARTLIRE